MKPSSAKAKGRTLQNTVVQMIRQILNLPDSDVRSATMGESGCDIKLSALAQTAFPFDDIECKCQEAFNIWGALKQSEARAGEDGRPLVVFKRNRSRVYAALPFEDLMQLCRENMDLKRQLGTVYVPKSPLD